MSFVKVLQNYVKNDWLKFGNDWLTRSGDFCAATSKTFFREKRVQRFEYNLQEYKNFILQLTSSH